VKNNYGCELTGRLLWIDANSVVGDDGRRGRIDFEFFSGKLEDGRERRGFRDAQPRFPFRLYLKKEKKNLFLFYFILNGSNVCTHKPKKKKEIYFELILIDY
jgi:hypothetical protein